MRLICYTLLLLALLALPALAEPGFIVDADGRGEMILDPSLLALPDGEVLALENGRIVTVEPGAQPQVSDMLVVQFSGPDGFTSEQETALIPTRRACVYANQFHAMYMHDGTAEMLPVDIVIQVCDFSKDDDDTDGPDDVQAEKLARGKRFMMGDIELVIYAPGFASFKATLTRSTLPAPVLSPPLPGDSPAIPRVLARPKPVVEKLGWISGSL